MVLITFLVCCSLKFLCCFFGLKTETDKETHGKDRLFLSVISIGTTGFKQQCHQISFKKMSKFQI